MRHTYILIAALYSSPAPYWTYLKSPKKFSTQTVQLLMS